MALALHATLAWISWRPPRRLPMGDEGLYLRAARQLLASGSFDLEPLWPPLYPVFLAFGKTLGGGSWWGVVLVQVALLLWVAWLVRDLAGRLVGKGMVADLASLFVLLHPTLAAFCHYFWPEVLHLALMTTAFWLLARPSRGWVAMFTLGMLLGLALASKAILGPLVPLLLLVVAYRPEGAGDESGTVARTRTWHLPWMAGAGLRTRTWHLSPAVWVALGLLLGTLPWMAWNGQRTGSFVLSDSVAFNLALGLENTSRREMVDSRAAGALESFLHGGTSFDERRDRQWQEVARLVRSEGPLTLLRRQLGSQYFRLFHVDSNLVHQLPGGALAERGKGYREGSPLLARGLRLYAQVFHLALWALAWAGALLLVHRRHPWLWGGALFLLYNFALFLALHVTTRYRLQLVPFLAIYAAGAIAWWQVHQGAGKGDAAPSGEDAASFVEPTARTWGLVVVGCMLLLWLAWG